MDIAIGNRSASSGRFNFVVADGDVSFDDTEAHAVVTGIVEQKNSWWYDARHGSDLYTLRKKTTQTPSIAEAYAYDGVQPLIDQQVIANFDATASTSTPGALNALSLDVSWTTPDGTPQTQTIGG